MPSADGTFLSRWGRPFIPGIGNVRQQDTGSDGQNPGFINSLFQATLALCVLASPHHILQSLFPGHRYVVTDIYVLAWTLLGAALAACALAAWSPVCFAPESILTFVAGYRLLEILSRELWIILYRHQPLTSVSRVLSVSLLNYFTATSLFGYLYGTGGLGLRQAATISLAFAPFEPPLGLLQIVQGAYCVAFLIVVVAAFVARANLNPPRK